MPIQSDEDILYLRNLKPDINLKIWLSGFDKEGNWKIQSCIEYYRHINDVNKDTKKINNKTKKNVNLKYKNTTTVAIIPLRHTNSIRKNLQYKNDMKDKSFTNNNIIEFLDSTHEENIPAEFFNSHW